MIKLGERLVTVLKVTDAGREHNIINLYCALDGVRINIGLFREDAEKVRYADVGDKVFMKELVIKQNGGYLNWEGRHVRVFKEEM